MINLKDKFVNSIKKSFDDHPLVKFLIITLLIIFYFLFVTRSHGVKNGFGISILTWSFFVLCTPIADAGILIDFPMRLITGIKMIYSETVVWIIAIGLNLFVFFNNPTFYDKTILLSLFEHILETPFPYWGIIILSGLGTFLSIYLADSLFNSKKIKRTNLLIKYKIIIFIFLILLIVTLYDFLLNKLGVHIPLI